MMINQVNPGKKCWMTRPHHSSSKTEVNVPCELCKKISHGYKENI